MEIAVRILEKHPMDLLQFYPTPPDLARRAWKMFKNTNFRRMLEPSGGNGDLATNRPASLDSRDFPIDVFEIDLTKHPVLRSKKLNVVGGDFLRMTRGDIYSHCLMNPPFAEGAKHVLKAWDVLWDAELVCILNAETIRNPFTREREHLVDLILQHGHVEFVEGAFEVEEAERKTSVDVALVYLKKTANITTDIVGDLFADMDKDEKAESLAAGYAVPHELTLPNSYVENSVRAFNAAVRSMRDAVFAQARANYYSALLGETMAVRNAGEEGEEGSVGRGNKFTSKMKSESDTSVGFVQKEMAEKYEVIKDRAWTSVLRSTNVTSRLSSSAQRRVESQFEDIKKFEFSCENIYAFLTGIVQSQGEIQIEMICDCFDAISRFHTDNAVFYKRWSGSGWKSNDKHRTHGMKVKHTRFILPGHGTGGWRSSLSWDSTRLLEDFDRSFAMLDGGKLAPAVSLVQVFNEHFKALCAGERVSSSYFDLRFYPGKGTIHFFPTRPDLIDRLNRVVGAHRQWIPAETSPSEAFWEQFDKAEKFDKELRAEVKKMQRGWWNNPLDQMMSTHASEEQAEAFEGVTKALDTVLERHGINPDFQIEQAKDAPLLLAA